MQGVSDHGRLVAGDVVSDAGSPAPARPGADAREFTDHARFVVDEDETTPRRRKAGPLLFWSTCLLGAFLVFWISGGHRLVLEPLTETIRNAPVQALHIEDVTSRIERRGNDVHLLVEGGVRNYGADAFVVPHIVIAVSATDGPTTRYFLETSVTPLAPGAQYGFSSRLDAPAGGVASVSITFQEGSR